jgi:hypothetical protein
MQLSQFKELIKNAESIEFLQTNGKPVPAHFHITDMGTVTKSFIDCGRVFRTEKKVTFQIWYAGDTEHRLTPDKITGIINASASIIGEDDPEIEVEYQVEETIGKFGLGFSNGKFVLTSQQTTCLAQDFCGIPEDKRKLSLKDLPVRSACCAPGSSCC